MDKEKSKEESRRFGPGSDNQDIGEHLIEVIEKGEMKRIVVGSNIFNLHPSQAKECIKDEMDGASIYFLEKYSTKLN